MTQAQETSDKTGKQKAMALSARLRAAQAVYQVMQNGESLRDTAAEYLSHRLQMDVDGEALIEPDRELLKTILLGVHDVFDDLQLILDQNLTLPNEQNRDEEGDVSDEASTRVRSVDPLLRAVLICAAYELVIKQAEDSPIIINDYLNVTHSFYDKNEASLVNALLDKIAKSAT